MPTASEILDKVRAAYRECTSYADTGEVKTVMVGGSFHRHTSIKPFSTSFVRPDRFRFEFREASVGPEEDWPRYVVWSSSGEVRSWWTIRPEVDSHESVHGAIAGATGVSDSSAYRVPTLLLPGGTGRDPLGADRRVDRTEESEGVWCFVLAPAAGDDKTLWVAADTFLIHRVEQTVVMDAASRARSRREMEGMLKSRDLSEDRKALLRRALEGVDQRESDRSDVHVETTTVYRPELDVEIEEERFGFEPPFVGKPRWS